MKKRCIQRHPQLRGHLALRIEVSLEQVKIKIISISIHIHHRRSRMHKPHLDI